MLLLPAIDLFDGRAVRLFQGDYNKMTVYSDCPAETAENFRQAGCEWVHLVDLQGAKSGRPENLPAIREILQKSGLKAEVGGGIRTGEAVRQILEAGAERVILGTAALQNPEFLQQMLNRYGDRIAVGIDCRDGFVSVRGWTETSPVRCEEFCGEIEKMGVQTVICTDISRDGTLAGTNTELYAELNRKFSIRFIASGGISSLEDLRRLRRLGLYGAILGKAYYTGAVSLREALEAVSC
jgi:phosphoribosylformimino-5-aminoimidazole carboxamide ribotide isomerase